MYSALVHGSLSLPASHMFSHRYHTNTYSAATQREDQLKSAMGDEGAASAAARDLATKNAAERDALAEELAKVCSACLLHWHCLCKAPVLPVQKLLCCLFAGFAPPVRSSCSAC
jgi:hypothetical protein